MTDRGPPSLMPAAIPLPHPATRPAIALPIQDHLLAGLTREQTWLFSAAAAGLDLMIEGSAGTGKSHLTRRYLVLRQQQSDTHVTVVSSAEHALSWPADITLTPTEEIPRPPAGRASILILDELSCMTDATLEKSAAFGQVLINGDETQEADKMAHLMACGLIHARGGIRLTLTQAFRSANPARDAITNALLHHGIYDTIPTMGATQEAFILHQSTAETLTADLLSLASHHITTNPHSRLLLAAPTHHALAALHDLATQAAATKPQIHIRVLHSSRIQGAECDVLIATPSEDEPRFVLHALSRARHRTEIVVLPPHDITRRIFTLRAETTHPEHGGLNWMPDPQSPTDSLLILPGPDPRAALRRVADAAARRWRATTGNP